MEILNHQFRLINRPFRQVSNTDWHLVEETLREPEQGEVQVKVLYVALEPGMRGWLADQRDAALPPVRIGDVMRAAAVGQVTASRHPRFKRGDHVSGLLGVQEYAVMEGAALTRLDARKTPLLVGLGAAGATIVLGLKSFPDMVVRLFSGQAGGKLVLQVAVA